jgi:hypothetical protein
LEVRSSDECEDHRQAQDRAVVYAVLHSRRVMSGMGPFSLSYPPDQRYAHPRRDKEVGTSHQ